MRRVCATMWRKFARRAEEAGIAFRSRVRRRVPSSGPSTGTARSGALDQALQHCLDLAHDVLAYGLGHEFWGEPRRPCSVGVRAEMERLARWTGDQRPQTRGLCECIGDLTRVCYSCAYPHDSCYCVSVALFAPVPLRLGTPSRTGLTIRSGRHVRHELGQARRDLLAGLFCQSAWDRGMSLEWNTVIAGRHWLLSGAELGE